MIHFDFMSPYLVYIIYVSFTLCSLVFIILKPEVVNKHRRVLGIIAFFLLLYAQIIRYGLPYLAGNPSLPFYLTRIASIVVLVFLLIPSKKLYPLVFFYASTSIFPVFFPAGPIGKIGIHNESFFIDHYIASLMPFYLMSVKSYNPKLKELMWAIIPLAILIFAFVPINKAMNWGYFFMNRHNVLLHVFPNLNWWVFAVIFVVSITLWYFIYYHITKKFFMSRS